MKLKLLRALDGLLLGLRYPFIGRYGWTPSWLLKTRLVPMKWVDWTAHKIEKLEETEGLC